jgi:hypothetical protein
MPIVFDARVPAAGAMLMRMVFVLVAHAHLHIEGESAALVSSYHRRQGLRR